MKKIHRFFVEQLPTDTTITLSDTLAFHIGHILKLKPGERIALFADKSGDSICEIVSVSKKEITLERKEILPVRGNPPRELIAAVAIIKKDLFETIVQKLTEVGVSTIVPLQTDRTVKQSIRRERLQQISDEALELCGASTRVAITEPMTLRDCMSAYPQQAVCLSQHGTPLRDTVLQGSAVMYVGPEGGWSAEEEALFSAKTAVASLGSRTLRAETAAIIGAYHILWNL